MNAWDHLPNAKHIDRVLASVTANPELWSAAWDDAALLALSRAVEAAWGAAGDADRVAVWNAAWDAAGDAASDAARCAILALIAYDDCAHMLDSDIGELKILAASGDTRAILLLPACIVFAKEKELLQQNS